MINGLYKGTGVILIQNEEKETTGLTEHKVRFFLADVIRYDEFIEETFGKLHLTYVVTRTGPILIDETIDDFDKIMDKYLNNKGLHLWN